MFYVINDKEAVACDWLFSPVRRVVEKKHTCTDLDVVPYTEKGEPSKKYKPFRIRVFNYPDYSEVWVYGLDKYAYYCAREMQEHLEKDEIAVFFKRLNPVHK